MIDALPVTPLPTDYRDPSLPTLQDALPAWMDQRPTVSDLSTVVYGSVIFQLLQLLANRIDWLAYHAEQLFNDTRLQTAGHDALVNEWAVLWGAENEQNPLLLELDLLRGHLLQRAGENGSTESLREALLALLRSPANDAGTALHFPADGSGLHFPADGSGLTLWQGPTPERDGLHFPADGSGLHFPADGSGLHFPTTARVEIEEHPADHYITVRVLGFLAFDRPSFYRAVNRFRLATDYEPEIIET